MKKLISAAMIACAFGAEAMTPGGVEKKCIGLLFDVFGTTPSNILANADLFAEHAPYLDGVAIGLHDVLVQSDDGGVVTSQFHRIMNPTQHWTRDAVKDQLPILTKIARKPNLGESFLLFWMTPGDRGARIDWADDKGWANYAESMATVAWLAKEAGLRGLMLDPEEYGAQGGSLPQYIHTYRDPPFAETAKLARQRGREVFSRVFKEFPDAVIFSLWCFHKFNYWLEQGRQMHPLENVDQSGELLHYYLNGLLDVIPPEARVVEGAEAYTGSALDSSFARDFVTSATTALPLVAPENRVKYRSQFLFGNTHYLDMYTLGANPKSNWYHGPVNGSRLEHLRLNMEQSFRVATEYVWIYGENSGKLFDWRGGHYAKQKTWEEVIPGMTETIMLAKDPEGYAAIRMAALKKEGKLVNLAKDIKGFTLGRSSDEREFHLPENQMPAVKVKPGERYAVRMTTVEHGVEKGTERQGEAIPRVFWRKDGKRTSAAAIPLVVHYEHGKLQRGNYASSVLVEVPKGVDELVCDPGASLKLGERVTYWDLAVYNLLDPVVPVKAERRGKWNFDPEKKTLSDGCWTLSATLDAAKGELTVRGDDDKTIGAGVLDLSTAKADTGYSVTALGKLRNLPSLTALYAPDVRKVVDGGIAGSSNVTSVAIGELQAQWWARTPEIIRANRLETLGCKVRCPLSFKVFTHNHKRISVMRPENEPGVKGVKPGELYVVGLSMKRKGPGYVYLFPRFRGNGNAVTSRERIPAIAMSQPRRDGVWQSGEVVLRVPEGADEIYFNIEAEITEGASNVELRDFKVVKIGDPLPVWPEESLREKGK